LALVVEDLADVEVEEEVEAERNPLDHLHHDVSKELATTALQHRQDKM
jgi:hypothetical protein